MGIIVRKGTLPSGLTVGNVYMSFRREPVYVFSKGNGQYEIASSYNIFKERSASLPSETKFPLVFLTTNINTNVYNLLYSELKKIYTNYIDIE